jgi:hypothetical protein
VLPRKRLVEGVGVENLQRLRRAEVAKITDAVAQIEALLIPTCMPGTRHGSQPAQRDAGGGQSCLCCDCRHDGVPDGGVGARRRLLTPLNDRWFALCCATMCGFGSSGYYCNLDTGVPELLLELVSALHPVRRKQGSRKHILARPAPNWNLRTGERHARRRLWPMCPLLKPGSPGKLVLIDLATALRVGIRLFAEA